MKDKSIIAVLTLIILVSLTACNRALKVPDKSEVSNTATSDEGDVPGFENNDKIDIDRDFIEAIGTVRRLPESSKRRYTYLTLSEEEQKIYEKIYVAIANFEPVVKFDEGISFHTFQKIYPLIYLQEGQLFWLSGMYDIFDDKKFEIKLDYILSREEAGYAINIINRKTRELFKELSELNATDGDKALFIHDYVIENTEYDKKGSPISQSIYGSFIDGLAQTQGYVKLFNFLLVNSDDDIDAILSKGITESGNSYSWSSLRLDGEWYNTDLVMDDTPEGISYNFFNLTDSEILNKTHFQDLSYYVPPECKGEKYNYFRYNNLYANSYQQAYNILKTSLMNSAGEVNPTAMVKFSDKTAFYKTVQHLIDENGIENIIRTVNKKSTKKINNASVITKINDKILTIEIIAEYE